MHEEPPTSPDPGGHPPAGGDPSPGGDRTTIPSGVHRVAGEQIGPYRLLEKLGEGGMGEVWLAAQETPVRRRVALKLIKAGMDSGRVLARFEAERQALAMMNHPNIARVFDAGSTERGRPYFAMEFVDGEPITGYCDRQRLSMKDRLGLFMQVCEGVQHAHHKGIIHRDLKPSNVLVRVQEDKPAPKIIDFGVAKATDQRLTERTLYTQIGMLVGTPEYMSPEQAEMTGLDVDTRTDVYSLGVILYELLVGALPFDSEHLRNGGFEGMRRTIREEEPVRPSTRVTALGDGSAQAHQRRTDATGLRRLLRGDLDWITMKALEKDRTRRYDSPSALAADIRRHLGNEPVLAGPPSVGYRVGKFVRRHRVGVAAASAVLVMLVAATMFSTMQYLRAEAARIEAQSQAYVASLAAASAALEKNDAAGVRRHLAATAEELRGWEWSWLWNEADRSLGTAFELPRHSSGYDMGLSPSGRLVASREAGGSTEPVRLWDVATGELVRELPTWECRARHLTFSPDEKYLALGATSHGSAQIWSLADGRPILEAPQATAAFLGFDASAERVALMQLAGHSVVVQRISGGELVRMGAGWTDEASAGAFSDDGRLLAIGTDGGVPVRVFDPTTGELVRELDDAGAVRSVGFSLDGARLAVLARELRVYDTESWGLAAVVEESAGLRLGDVRFLRAPDGPVMVAAGMDGVLRAYLPGEPLARCETRGVGIAASSVAWDARNDVLLTAHKDGGVRRWPRFSGWTVTRPRGTGPVRFWRGDLVALASTARKDDPRVLVYWDTAETRPAGALRQFAVTHAHSGSVADWVEDPSGARVAIVTRSGWSQGRLKIFDVATALGIFTPEPFWGHDPRGVAWSADGVWIAIVGTDGFGRTYCADDPDRWFELRGHSDDVTDVVFTDDGRVVTAGEDGTIRCWAPETGKELASFAAPDSSGQTWLGWLGNPPTLASGTEDGTILFWDLARGEVTRTLDAHSAAIREVTMSPDLTRLVSGAIDGSVTFWDPGSWRELLSLRLEESLQGLAFSADGSRLALGDDRIRVLDARSEAEREKARRDRREARHAAEAWLDDLEASATEPAGTLERIAASDVHTDVVKAAAMTEFLARRDPVLAAAWEVQRARALAEPAVNRQMLRDLCVSPKSSRWWPEFREAEREIRARTDVSDAEREGAADFALGMRYWNHSYLELRGEGVWTNRIIRGLLANEEEERRGDRALALFAAQDLVEAVPGNPEYVESLGFAEYRAGLFEDAAATLAPAVVAKDASAEVLAFAAMSHARRGRAGDASAALARGRAALGAGRWAVESEARDLVAEAEVVLVLPAAARRAPPASRDSLESFRTELGVGNPTDTFAAFTLAERRWNRGDLKEAERLLRRCIDQTVRDSGRHRGLPLRLSMLGQLRHAQEDDEEAERLLREALALCEEIRGREHPDVVNRLVELAWFLLETGRPEEGEAAARDAVERARSIRGYDHAYGPAEVGVALLPLGRALEELDRAEDAVSVCREALDLCRANLETGDWRIGEAQSLLGQALSDAGRFEEAEPLLLEGYRACEPPGRFSARREEARQRVVAFHGARGEPESR